MAERIRYTRFVVDVIHKTRDAVLIRQPVPGSKIAWNEEWVPRVTLAWASDNAIEAGRLPLLSFDVRIASWKANAMGFVAAK